MARLKRFIKRVKRLLQFIPKIWKGYDWDYRYAVDLFSYQLDRTANEIEERGWAVNAKMHASKIRTATRLMKKVYDEEYLFEYLDEFEAKYGPSKIDFVEVEGTDFYEMVERFDKEYSEQELELIKQERWAMRQDAKAKQEKAHKLLWKYIDHNIQHWWD